MEEFTMLQSMLNILNSNNKKKKAVIETLPILLETYDIHAECELFSLIVICTQNLCFEVFDSQNKYSNWKDSDVSLDDLKPLLIYLIDIIKKHSDEDIVQLFQHCLELTNKVNFKSCSHQQISNIGFCLQKLYILCAIEKDDNTHLNHLRNTLVCVINEPHLNKSKLDTVVIFLSNIVSINYIPTLWQQIKPLIKTHPHRLISLLFNMQCLLFDYLCVDVILNDDDFWNLLCSSMTCENNIIRTYNNVILKLACSQLLNENINYCPSQNREQCIKLWNDYVVVMETLENSQQHLILPILSTAKNLALKKNEGDIDDYKLPLKWITAMYCKMSKHSSKYVVLASIDIVTNMSIISLKTNKLLLQSFVDSLNNVSLYKMSSELNVDQPQLEIILTLWFNKLMMSSDGHEIFCTFLSHIPTIKWTIVPLIFLTKSLTNISLDSPFEFNIINYVLQIKSIVDKMPKSYLKTVVLSFLFIFVSKFLTEVNTEFNCELFDCIMVFHENTKSWNYITNSVKKISDLHNLDKELTQLIIKNNKMYSTSIGLLILSNIFDNYPVSIKMLDESCFNTTDLLDKLDLLECLLQVESNFGRYNTYVSEILDKYVWPLTTIWVEKCLVIKEECLFEDSIICCFLDKVLSSNRIINTNRIINNWLIKCKACMEYKCNYNILAIYSWIGKYATKNSTEHKLNIDWMSFTEYFIGVGYFSIMNQGFYHSKKPGIHKIPLLDIINTFFQYSTVNSVSEEQMLDIFVWLTEKTIERHDNYWTIYFSTVETFLCKFPIKVHSSKIIQFVSNCWEFLVNCRVSCFPNATKSFIEMAFHYSLLSEETYVQFLKNQIIQNILTEKYRDTFNVCFSLLLLNFLKSDQSNIITILESHQIVSEFFAKCLLFSIDRYGAVKIEWDTFEYIQTLKDFPLINDITVECLADDKYLRFSTINFLYKLNSNMLWKNVLNTIVKNESLLKDRKFFHNSKAHRIKQRVVQVLLVVACDKHHEPLIFEENIYKWLLSSLKEVSHIHSVSYQLIWLLVIIYNKYLNFYDFCNDFKKAAKENHNYLCSFISIIYHQLRLKNKNLIEIEAKKLLLPLCFSNGYKIRLYAQTTICKLLSDCSEETKWSLLCEAINNIISENEQTKKYENPFHDFFYQDLDIFNSLSLKNVCIEVPRLLNIVYEERFPVNWFNDFSMDINKNNKYDLTLCSVSAFIEKSTTSVITNAMDVVDNAQNAQRKYVPSQPISEHLPNSMLIVVASLLDKETNLGGLARTCQVFGASTLVVDNLSCVEKREFTALSMSAEKHQCMIEVKIKNLKSYLQKKKNEGYQIVAAEQTIDSVKLHDIKLPFKCVLLLGNETSGVPHNLLSIMDACVEIEQLGIVRSLNVHVAGSLFIWEYTKQHCLKVSNFF